MAGFDTTDTSYEYDTGGRLRRMSYDSENDSTKFFLWYDYDTAGRLWKIYANTSDSPPDSATAVYTYNARGQVTQEVIKSTMGTAVQTVDFTYNSRGLLTKINDLENPGTDRFALEIGYDGKVTGGPTTNWSAQKNGNISQIKWRNTKISANPFYYTFGYDSRDQLTKADRDSTLTFGDVDYTSDGNGNLATLDRGTAWTYCYDGDETNTNRVDDITNRGSDDNWDYDQSGRQTKDTWAGFTSATYHFPGAAFHDITMSGGTLQMRYNGNNRRLQKKVVNGTTTNYVRSQGGQVLVVFEDNGQEVDVERYVWGPLGLVAIVKGTNTSASWSYTVTDHLGSIRSVVDSLGTAMAGYDYYPFGMILWSDVSSNRDSRFKFGAKEYDTELDLNLYYFEARFYNPEIGRFAAPDPLRQGWSHYAFCSNNPVRFIDPTGMITNDARGETEYAGGDYGDSWSLPTGMDHDFGFNPTLDPDWRMTDASGELFSWYDYWDFMDTVNALTSGNASYLTCPRRDEQGNITWYIVEVVNITKSQFTQLTMALAYIAESIWYERAHPQAWDNGKSSAYSVMNTLAQQYGETHVYNFDGSGYGSGKSRGVTGWEGKTPNYGGAVGFAIDFNSYSLSQLGIADFRQTLVHETSHAFNLHTNIKSKSDLQRFFPTESRLKEEVWYPAHQWINRQHQRGFTWW